MNITAAIHQLDNGGVLLTDYVGDVVNLLINKPKPYRLCYLEMDDVWLIADAMTYLHEEMIDIALQEGWIPNSSEFMQKYNEDVSYFDANRTVNLIFLTDEALSKFGSYTDPFATAEFGYEYPIITGSIFTKSNLVSNYFQRSVPDLYNKLQKYAIPENRIMEDYLW
jgi:hypothetical protein